MNGVFVFSISFEFQKKDKSGNNIFRMGAVPTIYLISTHFWQLGPALVMISEIVPTFVNNPSVAQSWEAETVIKKYAIKNFEHLFVLNLQLSFVLIPF